MEDACCCFAVGTNSRAHTVNPTQNPAPPIRTSLRFVFIVCWTDKTPVCSRSLTARLTDAAPTVLSLQPERHRGVRCSRLVSCGQSHHTLSPVVSKSPTSGRIKITHPGGRLCRLF